MVSDYIRILAYDERLPWRPCKTLPICFPTENVANKRGIDDEESESEEGAEWISDEGSVAKIGDVVWGNMVGCGVRQ